MITIPLLQIEGTLYVTNYYAELSKSIPAFTLTAEGGGYASLTLPHVTLSTESLVSVPSDLSKSIPAIRLTASAIQDYIGNLTKSIPAIRLITTATLEEIGSLSRPIPHIKLTASGLTDLLGVFESSIGAIKLTSSAYWMGTNDGAMAIPSIRLHARARGDIIALSLNTKNFGLTKYTNYDYNSLCIFDGAVIGAKRTGIYELSGLNDDGTAIPWKLRTGKLDLKTNRLRHVWLSGSISGDIKMIIETAEGDQYEYDVEPVSESEDEIRAKIGKGLSSKYVTIELQNESDETIHLDAMKVYGMKGDRNG